MSQLLMWSFKFNIFLICMKNEPKLKVQNSPRQKDSNFVENIIPKLTGIMNTACICSTSSPAVTRLTVYRGP